MTTKVNRNDLEMAFDTGGMVSIRREGVENGHRGMVRGKRN